MGKLKTVAAAPPGEGSSRDKIPLLSALISPVPSLGKRGRKACCHSEEPKATKIWFNLQSDSSLTLKIT